MSSLNDKLIQLGETKNLIKNAIIGKGVDITPDTPFREYANKIAEISGGGSYTPLVTELNITPTDKNLLPFNDFVYAENKNPKTKSDITLNYSFDKAIKNYEIALHMKLGSTTPDGTLATFRISSTSESSLKAHTNPNSYFSYLWADNGSISASPERFYDPLVNYTSDFYIKYTFDDNTMYINSSFDNKNYTTQTITKSGVGNIIFDALPIHVFGDVQNWDSSTRNTTGALYYKGTYIKDLTTDSYVWELLDGSN